MLTFVDLQLQARLGELNFVAANTASEGSEQQRTLLFDALQRFSRSLELCDDYLRAFYGLKLVRNSPWKLSHASNISRPVERSSNYPRQQNP